jgi:hypothetical protein
MSVVRARAENGGILMRGGTTALFIEILAACAPRIAHSGPTTGAGAPPGSYIQTCGAISYDPPSTTLTATCAPRSPQQTASTIIAEAAGGFVQATLSPVTSSLQVSYCDPAADIDNVNAHLQCKALAGTWGQAGAVPNGSYQESCQYWTVMNGANGAATLNAQCWTYARGAIDYFAAGPGAWASAQLDLTQCDMAGDIQNNRGQLLCQPAPVSPPPPPGPPQNLRTSNNGSGILVSWVNPPGVLKATVSRTPAWPSSVSTLNIAPPRNSLQDELAVSGQPYAYNVCLSFQAGNACAPVSGQLPASSAHGTPQINHQIDQHVVVGMETAPGGHTPPAPPRSLNPGAGRLALQTQTGLCEPGFVWRQAYGGDQVCVTPQARRQAAADNRTASARQTASGLCVRGYVWRAANPQDHVCVTPQTRAQTAQDNASAHYAAVR